MNTRAYELIRKDLIETVGSGFVSITFIKKDGTERQMTCNIPAIKAYAGKSSEAAAKRRVNYPNLLNVVDVVKKAPRTVNLETVTSIKFSGQEIWK